MNISRSRRLQHVAVVGFGFVLAYLLGPALVGSVDDTYFLMLLAGIGAVLIIFRPLWGVYLTLFLSPLKIFEFGSGLLSLTRIAGLWTALALLIYLTVRGKKFRRTGIEGPIFLMVLGMWLSFFRTSETELVALSIVSLLSLYALVFLIVNLVEDEAQLKELTLVFLASAVYPIGVAISEWFQYPYKWIYIFRSSGTFTKPTGLGGFLIPVVLMALPLLFYAGFSRGLRWLIIGVFAGGVVALILSFSRSPWIGALLGLAVLLLTPLFDRMTGGKRLAAVVPMVLLIGAVWYFWPLIDERLVTPVADLLTTGTSTESVLIRRYDAAVGPRIILGNYFLGTGIGNYGREARRYGQILETSLVSGSPHNIFFYFFGEVGIVGAAGFIWLVAWLYRWVRSHHRHMMTTAPGLTFYVYVGSLASLVAYVSYMFFHSGFFTNEIWIGMAFLMVTTRLGQEMTERISERPDPPSGASG